MARCSVTLEKLSASDPTKAPRVNNQLYFGDNLHVLRDSIKDASVDLIYLDPPFNSKRDYDLLFKTSKARMEEVKADQTKPF